MKTSARLLMLITGVVILSVFAGPATGSLAAPEACTNPIFASLLESLKSKTSVPLRLPLVVGGDYDAALYADVGWVGNARYVVRIGQQCERSYCPYGTVSGAKISERAGRPAGKAVELSGGVTGYLADGSKTSKNSTITWDEEQYRYSITIYAAEPSALVKVANSALSCDNR